jgi:uncharacterized protein (TIGR00730 family)
MANRPLDERTPALPPRSERRPARTDDAATAVDAAVDVLLRTLGHDPADSSASFVAEMIATNLKFLRDGADTGQLKLVTSALKEMRYAYRVFNRYRGVRKISIFGSARTAEGHPDYAAAKRFGELIAAEGWMAITGAGGGIMKAGHEGPSREASFGLAIRLPSEQAANAVIDGDPKLINFRYFFTRKLMFTSNSAAIAVFPGGYGTQDELFECLTLAQTGKMTPLPIVLVEGAGGDYWATWERFAREDLIRRGWISPGDESLYRICRTPEEAVTEVVGFYRRYRSSRFVGDRFALRLDAPLSPAQLVTLDHEFGGLCRSGRFEQSAALLGEDDALELPRISFVFTRRDFAALRRLIDRINAFPYDASAVRA